MSGTGGLTKVGGGAFTLTGASTYSGPTNVNAGILNVNGSLASTVFVNSGATLMGTGTIGGLCRERRHLRAWQFARHDDDCR